MPDHHHVVSVAYIPSPSSITELYLPLAAFECYHSVGEEGLNNSIAEAFGPFCLGATFFGRPDDKEDYLFFELNTETAVTIGLPTRPPTVQQLQLYRGSTNDLVASVGGDPYTVSCRLWPERYYVRVLAVEPFSATVNYRLTLTAAAHAPFCD
jgi:hypothetical protein